jgi:hypothetical protein
LSNSWLPTAETARPPEFSASIVGLSPSIAEMKVDAPMLSPADTQAVFGFFVRRSLIMPTSWAAPPTGWPSTVLGDSSRPWKSLTLSSCRSTGVAAAALVSRPTTTGSWSLARYGSAE